MHFRRLVLLAAALGIVAAACSSSGIDVTVAPSTTEATVTETQEATASNGLTAKDGDIVEVHYVGTLDDGSQFDSSRDRGTPLSFTVGTGQVISGFDAAVRGAQVGDTNTVRMVAADAYGEWAEENVVELPYDSSQGELVVGNTVTLNSGQRAEVLEVSAATVKLDANHRLAGEALRFEIEILIISRP